MLPYFSNAHSAARTNPQNHPRSGRPHPLFLHCLHEPSRSRPMTRPRATLVSPSDTPWYHVVRRAFLGGRDHARQRPSP